MSYTSSDLKYDVEHAGLSPEFFTRKTMKFFGDTMANYGVRQNTINDGVEVYELYRRRPVKHALQTSAYFDRTTFQRVFVRRTAQ